MKLVLLALTLVTHGGSIMQADLTNVVPATPAPAVASLAAESNSSGPVADVPVAAVSDPVPTALTAEVPAPVAVVQESGNPAPAALTAAAPVPVPTAADGPGEVVVQKDRSLMNWTQNYIESTGMAVAPKGTQGAQAKALARRGAIVDLQRNMLEFMAGVQIDSHTTMDDFMASDKVRSEVNGVIKNVELMEGDWDGEAYTISGRIKLPEIRVVVASNYKPVPVEKAEVPPAKRTSGKYTGLVIDVRHLPLVPSMTFNVLDENGRAVYNIELADHKFYLQSGLCAYFNNINYAKGDIFVATNPISTKAVRLTAGNVDIVIPNGDAAKVRGSSYDFRRECKVIIVK